MISSIQEFEYYWSQELEATQKVFKHLTDKSLSQAITPAGRTLGRLAWHITLSIPEIMSRVGITISDLNPKAPVPTSAKEIFHTYNRVAIRLLEDLRSQWNDDTLQVVDEMYGQRWKRGRTLMHLIFHQIHHRAQMIVLMRQAGLAVPGIYGPNREEWAKFGLSEPTV